MKSKTEITDYKEIFNDWYKGDNGYKVDKTLYEILVASKSKLEQIHDLKQLLKQVYNLGLKTAAQDSIDTLHQYATACAGLPSKNITPDEVYDAAAQGLVVYFNETLGNFEKNKE